MPRDPLVQESDGIMARPPQCCSCRVPSIWEIVNDPAEGWISLLELGWMCPECVRKSERTTDRLRGELS